MTNPNKTGVLTETYTSTKTTIETTVVPTIITQSDQIAHYFTEDLEKLVRLTNTDLAQVLQIPPEYSQDAKDIVLMLYEDISHMLRDQLITGIHLLLSDPDPDQSTSAYPLRYHARYSINTTSSLLQTSPITANTKREGGQIEPPKDALRDARFALLIDWNQSANDRRRRVRRPDYYFDWVPEISRFDATNLVRYREGGMAVDSAVVVNRAEAISPSRQQKRQN